MTKRKPQIKSPLYQQRLEALQAEFLQSPYEALADSIDAINRSLIQHRVESSSELALDARWLVRRMEELMEAFHLHDDPMNKRDDFYCRFDTRYED